MTVALTSSTTHLETDPRVLPRDARDALIISSRIVDGEPVIVSRYGDPLWQMVNQPTNKPPSEQTINFRRLPEAFQEAMRELAYRYLRRGREGQKRPGPRAVVKLVRDASLFLRYLESRSIREFADATPAVCSGWIEECRRHRVLTATGPKPMTPLSLTHRFSIVEAIFELSQYTQDPMREHPWPDTSSTHMSGRMRTRMGLRDGATRLIPDDVFTQLFQKSWALVESSAPLLDARDAWLVVEAKRGQNWNYSELHHELRRFVKPLGWRTAGAFNEALHDLRTACYIITASLSGCRNHELAFIQTGACYSTTSRAGGGDSDDVETYWWMRSQSTKSGAGKTEWMIPEAAVTALRVMERWAKPYQKRIATEIEERRARNPRDPEIGEALRHQSALFLAATPRRRKQVRTLSGQGWNLALKKFARARGLNWALASHQFRRKFANYAARSQFGDLRYLKEHFKHWSLEMTLGYAMNGSQEMELYAEIQTELDDIKAGVVESWLDPTAPLAGGYGKSIVAWRGLIQFLCLRTISTWRAPLRRALQSVVTGMHGAQPMTTSAWETTSSGHVVTAAATLLLAQGIFLSTGVCGTTSQKYSSAPTSARQA